MIGKEFKEKLYKVRSIVGNKCYNGINGMEHFTIFTRIIYFKIEFLLI
jgi:hypothetical protein